MDINFEYYKIFYYAAKYKNITKAAAALGSSQPNVTRIIRLLEAQLGCRLFIREPRGLSLTEAGEKLYSHVEIAYKHFMNAQEELGGKSDEERGTIELGATETALHLLLLDAMRRFKTAHPKIRIKVHNHNTPELLQALNAGKIDFAVITTPFKAAKTHHCETLHTFHEILVGGLQYQALQEKPLSLPALKSYPLIGLGRGTATYDLYKDLFIAHDTDMELDMEVASSDLMLPLIQSSLGLGFVPEALAQPLLKKKRLVQIPLDAAISTRSIQIVSDKDLRKSAAADIFYQSLMSDILCKNTDTQNGHFMEK